jgi:hypothetical protein
MGRSLVNHITDYDIDLYTPAYATGIQRTTTGRKGKQWPSEAYAVLPEMHPAAEAGPGPALSNNPAPGFVKRFQVRHGLGAMPAFKNDVISKEDVKDIMHYLRSVKHSSKLPE